MKVQVATNHLSPSVENPTTKHQIMFRWQVQVKQLDTSRLSQSHQKIQLRLKIEHRPDINQSQYAFVAGHTVAIGTASYTTSTTTLQSSSAHGLVAGNRVQIVSSSGASPYYNYGDYIVKSITNVGTLVVTGQVKDPSTGTQLNTTTPNARILKHSLSANDASSDSSDENLSVRGNHLFDDEIMFYNSESSQNVIKVGLPAGLTSIMTRFPYGSYIQVDDEIMRVSFPTVTASDEIKVIRGALGTRVETHATGSLIRKIKPIPVEFEDLQF